MKKILKKNINIKKQIKINYLSTFLNNSQYIFIINDLSLKSQQFLDKFKNEFVNLNKIVIKSKLLINILVKKNILKKNEIFIKGPIILVGLNDLYIFKSFLIFIEIKNKNNLNLFGIILENLIIKKKDIPFFFINFLHNLSFFNYQNYLIIKYKKELLNLLLFSTYFIELKLINKLKFKNDYNKSINS